MPNLTTSQAEELAKYYSGLSLSTARYRLQHWDDISPAKRKELSDQVRELATQSDAYVKLAATLIMNDVESSLKKLRSITADIDKTIVKIASAQKIVNLMAAALDLGAAIISRDPLVIVKKIESFSKIWNSLAKKS